MRILLVEDSIKLADSLAQALRESGYVVDTLHDGGQADRVLLTETYDAIVLDLELPHLDGLTVLRRLRGRGGRTPVLVLTARGGLADRIQGLKQGADDYLPKPFDLAELEARLQALIRRSHASGSPQLTLGTLRYDSDSRVFHLGDKLLALRPKEHAVLEALLMRAGKAISKEQLFDKVFPADATTSADVLDIYIHRLRKHLAGSGAAIVTLRGLGYMIDAA
ncbi:MAG: response regulator [Burkholderiales bacterium]|nr:response regulator [Burkholderiales bacterium]